MPQMKRAPSSLPVALLTSAAIAFGAQGAAAQGMNAQAKEAYDRGTKAHDRGDFKKAAEEFAKADALAPSPVALQAALDAAVDADDALLGAELLERSKRANATGALAASIETARTKLGGRAGRVRVACPSGAQCSSTIDGAPFDGSKGLWIKSGPHALTIKVDGATDTRTIEVHGGEQLEVVPARGSSPGAVIPVASPPPASATASPGAGTTSAPAANGADEKHAPLSPVVFWIGTGVTVVLAGASTYYALRASSRHDDFDSAGCGLASTGSCPDLADKGKFAQTVANIGFAATGVTAAATIVIGVFFTDWNKSARAGRAPVVVPIAGGMGLSYAASF